MSTANELQPPTHDAGWYPDPAQVWAWRWFDGNDWTGTVNDGQTNHSDLASLMAVREEHSAGNTVLRIVGWGVGSLIAILAVFVVARLAGGTEHEPVAVVDGAELYAIVEFSRGQNDEAWVVVVEPGTPLTALESITRNLLALPQAQDRQIRFIFFDSDDEFDGYLEYRRGLAADFEFEDLEDLIDTSGKFDADTIERNTVGHVEWIDGRQEYVICPGTVDLCGLPGAVASFTE